jgi:glycosyltransferase involved in cell wall biosynthesis
MNKVLHVTECLNTGVYLAIKGSIISSPDFEHHLLYEIRKDSPSPDLLALHHLGVITYRWEGGLVKKRIQLNIIQKKINPNITHLHSSWAGFIGRLIPMNSRLVYSSHGFGFQRKDCNAIFRFAFYLIEIILQMNTSANIAYMPYEYALLRNILKSKKIYFANMDFWNFSFAGINNKRKLSSSSKNKQIVSIGRITRAKDPYFFLKVVIEIRKLGYVDDILWIGDGAIEYRELFRKNKIKVTGWLDDEELHQILSVTDAALLTSAWDSGPATLFQLINYGIPVILRDFPAAKYLPLESFSSPVELATNILKVFVAPEEYAENQVLRLNNFFQSIHMTPISEIYMEILR